MAILIPLLLSTGLPAPGINVTLEIEAFRQEFEDSYVKFVKVLFGRLYIQYILTYLLDWNLMAIEPEWDSNYHEIKCVVCYIHSMVESWISLLEK